MAKKKILINPVSLVHDRNVEVFRRALPDFTFNRIYNNRVPWFAGKKTDPNDGSYIFTGRLFPDIPEAAFEDVEALVLYTAQPRVAVCNLVEKAMERGIPVIAVEEVYLMALSQGAMHNYLLPVDHLFAASEHERGRFIESGIAPSAVETIGGVFRTKGSRRLAPAERDAAKRELGIPVQTTVVTLSLDVLASSGETIAIRRELLECAWKGLPDGHTLLVKPHPSDQHHGLKDLAAERAPGAIVVEKTMPIDKVLDVTDVLLNRGSSQVVLDALEKEVPVACIPCGKKTIFHGIADDIIIFNSGGVSKALSVIKARRMSIYVPLLREHLSIGPDEAISSMASRIRQIAKDRDITDKGTRGVELALFWAWLGYGAKALLAIEKARASSKVDKEAADAAGMLIRNKAGRREIDILRKWGGSGRIEWILQSLWIRSLYTKRAKVEAWDNEWLSDFPPIANRQQFMPFKTMLESVQDGKWSCRASESFKIMVKNAASICGL